MTTIPALLLIVAGALQPTETIDREGSFELSGGNGYLRENYSGFSYGVTYIGPVVGVGNLTISYDKLPTGLDSFTVGWRVEHPLSGRCSLSSEFGLTYVVGGSNVYYSDLLFSISANLVYQVTDDQGWFIGYEHKSHAYLTGSRNPGSNTVYAGIIWRF